jgi:nucleotide-binding universal stress UspA family protein
LQRFESILVIADEASWTDAVRDRAAWLAQSTGARLMLADVVDDHVGEVARLTSALSPARAKAVQAEMEQARATRLETLADGLRETGAAVEVVTLRGTSFLQIIRQVLRAGHDLVLKGAARGLDRATLRAPDLHLLRKCPCPVWILNGAMTARARRILAAVDPDPSDPVRDGLGQMVMELATALAKRDDARLDVLNAWHVWEESTLRHGLVNMPEQEIKAILAHEETEGRARLDALTGRFATFRDRMRVLHLKGNAADVIHDHVASEGIDTLVMGTVGRTGIAGFFIGNTAETVLNRVDCSVLAVKPAGFVSPVTLEADPA